MNSEVRVFCLRGPTISPEEVRGILPSAVVHPPAANGDLFRLGAQPGDVVLIIDGYYFNRLPVRHREVRAIIEAGVIVIGASSIGALRAAELNAFGMLGVGAIYRLYRDRVITGDDEVCVLHASEEFGFAPQSDALINMRVTFRDAVRRRILSPSEAGLLTEVARTRAFWQRQYRGVINAATERGLAEATARAFLDHLASIRRDVKHEDALRALRFVRDRRWRHIAPAAAIPRAPDVFDIRVWREEANEFQHTDGPLREHVVMGAAQMLACDYPRLHHRVALECLSVDGAPPPPPEDERVVLADFLVERGMSAGELPAWMDARGLRAEEVGAVARRQRTLSGIVGMSGDPGLEKLEELAVATARHRGVLAPLVTLDLGGWLTEAERDLLSTTQQLARVLTRALQSGRRTQVRGPFLAALKMDGDLAGALERAAATRTVNQQYAEKRPDISIAQLSSRVVLRWFATRWGRPADTFVAGAERGIYPIELSMLRLYYLFDKSRASAEAWQILGQDSAGPPPRRHRAHIPARAS